MLLQGQELPPITVGVPGASTPTEGHGGQTAADLRYRLLFEGMIEGCALIEIIGDETGQPLDYRYLAVNPSFERLTDLKAGAIIGRTARELWPAARPLWLEHIAHVARTQTNRNFDAFVEEFQRHIRVAAFSPAPGQCALLLEDISEQKHMEEERRSGEEKFRKLTALAPVGVCLTGAHNLCQYVNEKWAQMSGLSFTDMLGDHWMKAVHPEDRAAVSASWEAATLACATWMREYRLQTPEGRVVWVYGVATPLRDAGGNLSGYIGSHLDITERKLAESAQAEIAAKLQQMQKLESLGVLAGGIAHDFNNILMTILGNVDLVLQDLPPDAAARRPLNDVERAARRAAELCRQMLAYSGKGRFVVEPVNLNDVITDMVRMLDISISKKATLRYNLAQNLPAVEADATQLRQIIMNLVINASEAIGERHGHISITTSAIECDREFLGHNWLQQDLAEGLYVACEVADDGCGMAPEVRSRIFDPFFTTKFTGRGLGLAAVLGIVRGHKGAIKVESEPDRGTAFKILLPALAPPAIPLQICAPPKLWRGSGTVLLADDEEGVRLLGAHMLERLGFRCLTAGDGVEVLAQFKAHRAEIKAVILDLIMPQLDGEQTYAALRQLQPDVCIIMTSGYSEKDVAQRFRGQALGGFIQKPYRINALSEVLHTALAGAAAGRAGG